MVGICVVLMQSVMWASHPGKNHTHAADADGGLHARKGSELSKDHATALGHVMPSPAMSCHVMSCHVRRALSGMGKG